MSQHAGTTSTDGGTPSAAPAHQQQQQQQPAPNSGPQLNLSQFTSFDLATQQAILQQLAAARSASNPAAAALFANLTNFNAAARKASAGANISSAGNANTNTNTNASSASPGASSLNGSAASPNVATAPALAVSAASPSTSTPDVATLQAQLQARLIHAQQQAMQAAAMRQAQNTGQQQQQQPQPAAQSPADSTSKPQQPQGPPGIPDWASAAVASGMLSNLGTDREAIMKQLQVLQQSQQNRARHATLGGVGSPVNPTAASPAAMTAPSPASASAPTPGAENSAPSPGVMSALAAAVRPPGGAPAPGMPGIPGVTGGVVRPGMPRPPMLQKQQLMASLMAFFKSTNQPLPPEVFNGEQDGAFKLGGVWIELTDLFLAVFRLGGLIKLMQTPSSHSGQPFNVTDHPVWQHILVSKGVPLTLPTPVALPRQPGMDPNAPPQMTTNSVQYLVTGYRAWIFGFEQAMARSKLAAFQKQQAAAAAGVRPPQGASPAATPATPTAPGPPVGVPSAATAVAAASSPLAAWAAATQTPTAHAPTPPMAAPTPPVTAPSPATAATPAAPTPSAPTPSAPTPSAPTPAPPPVTTPATTAPSPVVPSPSIAIAQSKPSPEAASAPAGTPGSTAPTPLTINGNSPTTGDGLKRKRDIRAASASADAATQAQAMTPAGTPTAAPTPTAPAPAKPEGPPRPKRSRYRVEYRPLHFPHPMMGGWDERTISTSFPKHKFGRQSRPAQELQVDVEAVLMGLRSRIPREISYGLTVLSMLSMPLHDGKAANLPIEPLTDVYLEVLDLVAEAALGEGGVDQWLAEQQAATESAGAGASSCRSSMARDDVERMSYAELEQLGSDFEYAVEDEGAAREQSGDKSRTDIIFAGLNIVRNFSMLPENQPHMARTELFNTLAAVTDKALMRMPGEPATASARPYCVLEYARVCRDAVSIIANLGTVFDLRKAPATSVLAIFRLLANFLVSAWQIMQKREPGYGPAISIRQVPPATVLSIDRALEAFCLLTLPDHNREAVAAVVPADELVALFAALVRLFPISPRDADALRSLEDYLARVELVALSVYSLAFLAPQHARAGMRATAGTTTVMTRMVYGLTPQAPDLQASPFGILVRRVAETLGVLNGTVNPGGNAEHMSFSAGGVEGAGWRFASAAVQPGWLAYDTDRVLEAMGWGRGDGRIWRVDGPTFAELDGLWSA